MRGTLPWRSALLAAGLLSCGDPCPTEGCEALNARSDEKGTGIAGVVAQLSDVVANRCQECPFGVAGVNVWSVDAPLESSSDVSRVVAQPALQQVTANERFKIELDAGNYLVCVINECVNVVVKQGAITTLNVRLTEGPVAFFMDHGGTLEQVTALEKPSPN
ncbi:MAG TPA: hypothetical protein VHM70_00215 [Polyangiaceae bacterium]|jgi:hypothetical protein|nr:hypothetical protein [Polyangiaceae bacterium]